MSHSLHAFGICSLPCSYGIPSAKKPPYAKVSHSIKGCSSLDGWRTGEKTDRCMDRCIDGWRTRRMGEWMDRYMNERLLEWIDG